MTQEDKVKCSGYQQVRYEETKFKGKIIEEHLRREVERTKEERDFVFFK